MHSAIKEAQATGINKVAETMHVQFIAKQIMQFAHELGLKVTGRDLGRLQDLVAHDPDAAKAVYAVMGS